VYRSDFAEEQEELSPDRSLPLHNIFPAAEFKARSMYTYLLIYHCLYQHYFSCILMAVALPYGVLSLSLSVSFTAST
jgi:hypothetical protein